MYKTYYIKSDEKLDLSPVNSLCWNVFEEDFNGQKIETVNLFDYKIFVSEITAVTKVCGEDFNFFAHQVYSNLLYYFWSKSEREIILTSWPPYIDKEELDNINQKIENYKSKELSFYRETVNLTISRKIDVFEQVMMNWEIFINYLWNNRQLLRKIVPIKHSPVSRYRKLYKYYIEKGEMI